MTGRGIVWRGSPAVLLLLLAAGLSACGPMIRNYNGDGVRVFVANEGTGTVRVTVQQQDGSEQELGHVDRFQYRFFELNGTGNVVVHATPDHGSGVATDSIRLAPGRVLDLRLGHPPQRLRWTYY